MSTTTPPRPRSARLVRLGRSAEYGGHAVALGAVVVAGPVGVVLCSLAAGGTLPWWTLVLAPLLLLLLPRAGTVLPGLVTLLLLGVWTVTTPGPFTWWALPAGACLLLFHLAAAALASTPTTVRWAAGTVRRWGRRTAVVLVVTTAVAGSADLVRHAGPPGSAVVGVLALLLVAAWPWVTRSPDRD